MSERLELKTGECIVWGPARFYAAEPEVILGEKDGPVGYAFANLLGSQVHGFSRLFALVDVSKAVRPPTIIVPKIDIRDMDYAYLFGGPVQAGVADGVLDAVEAGYIPKDKVDDIVIIVLVWFSPALFKQKNVDYQEVYKTNRESVKEAIRRAMAGEPTIDQLLAEDRSKPRHLYYNAKTGKWMGKTLPPGRVEFKKKR